MSYIKKWLENMTDEEYEMECAEYGVTSLIFLNESIGEVKKNSFEGILVQWLDNGKLSLISHQEDYVIVSFPSSISTEEYLKGI